jgi:CubicO group peptidase (beta-lactamase class C family)
LPGYAAVAGKALVSGEVLVYNKFLCEQTIWDLMKMSCPRKVFGVLLLSAGMTGGASALPRAEPETLGFVPARLALITDTLQHYVDAGHIPGLVAGIARHGRIVYLESLGWQDVEQQIPMRSDAMFQIRSMSKPVVSLAVMQLIESGQLGLDDPVSRYIPAFADMRVLADATGSDATTRPASRQMTVSDLLLHTSGLSHRTSALYVSRGVRSRDEPLSQLVEKVAQVPLIADPGTLWSYSISTTILGHVVEIVSGLPLDDYLQASILEPLNMPDTGFHIPADKLTQRVHIYRLGADGMQREPDMDIPITRAPPLLEGAAGLVSTVPDYLRFLQAFMNHGELDGQRILTETGVELMTQNQLPDAVLPIALNPQRPMRDLGWGYGFSVVIDEAESGFARNNGEFGWNGSLGTFSWADPQTGLVAVLMMQIQPSGAYNLSALFKSLVSQSITQ